MKTLNFKNGVLTIVATIFGFTVMAQTEEAFGTQNTGREVNPDIRRNVTNIQIDRDQIDELRARLDADRDAGKDMAVINDKRDLKKARANLMKNRAYLQADKKAIACTHRENIKDSREELRKSEWELSSARWQLFKDRINGNTEAIKEDKNIVAQKKSIVEQKKNEVNRKQEAMNEEMVAVNDEVKKASERPYTSSLSKKDESVTFRRNRR